jgi:antitoxin HigA-1
LRLARYFGNDARFWMNLQTAFELASAEQKFGRRIVDEITPDAA